MFSSNQDSIKSSQKDLVLCHLVEFFFLTLKTCSSFPNNSLTHGFQPTDNCCHRICNKGYKVSKNKEEKIPKTRLMGINIYHWLFDHWLYFYSRSQKYPAKLFTRCVGSTRSVACSTKTAPLVSSVTLVSLSQGALTNFLTVVDFKHFVPLS